jgi:hypothetical protein
MSPRFTLHCLPVCRRRAPGNPPQAYFNSPYSVPEYSAPAIQFATKLTGSLDAEIIRTLRHTQHACLSHIVYVDLHGFSPHRATDQLIQPATFFTEEISLRARVVGLGSLIPGAHDSPISPQTSRFRTGTARLRLQGLARSHSLSHTLALIRVSHYFPSYTPRRYTTRTVAYVTALSLSHASSAIDIRTTRGSYRTTEVAGIEDIKANKATVRLRLST